MPSLTVINVAAVFVFVFAAGAGWSLGSLLTVWVFRKVTRS